MDDEIEMKNSEKEKQILNKKKKINNKEKDNNIKSDINKHSDNDIEIKDETNIIFLIVSYFFHLYYQLSFYFYFH